MRSHADLFAPVAHVLAFLHRLRTKGSAAGTHNSTQRGLKNPRPAKIPIPAREFRVSGPRVRGSSSPSWSGRQR
jgi:hypothetical protein